MDIVIPLLLHYLACFGFYHADPQRCAIGWIKCSAVRQRWLQTTAWCLSGIALLVLAHSHGWERAIPIGLGTFTIAGISSLFLAKLSPFQHRLSGVYASVGVISLIAFNVKGVLV